VEWGDKFPQLLPSNTIHMLFEPYAEQGRRLIIQGKDEQNYVRVQEVILCWPL
jgi:hypothetical protein